MPLRGHLLPCSRRDALGIHMGGRRPRDRADSAQSQRRAASDGGAHRHPPRPPEKYMFNVSLSSLDLLQVTLRHDFLRRFLPLFRPGMIRLMNKRVARVTTTTTAAASATTTTTTTTCRLTFLNSYFAVGRRARRGVPVQPDAQSQRAARTAAARAVGTQPGASRK